MNFRGGDQGPQLQHPLPQHQELGEGAQGSPAELSPGLPFRGTEPEQHQNNFHLSMSVEPCKAQLALSGNCKQHVCPQAAVWKKNTE